jgi:hypothetical protein
MNMQLMNTMTTLSYIFHTLMYVRFVEAKALD